MKDRELVIVGGGPAGMAAALAARAAGVEAGNDLEDGPASEPPRKAGNRARAGIAAHAAPARRRGCGTISGSIWLFALRST